MYDGKPGFQNLPFWVTRFVFELEFDQADFLCRDKKLVEGNYAKHWLCQWPLAMSLDLTSSLNRSLRSLGRAKARPLTKR